MTRPIVKRVVTIKLDIFQTNMLQAAMLRHFANLPDESQTTFKRAYEIVCKALEVAR